MTGDGDLTKASHVPLFSNSIVEVTFGAPNIVGRGSGKPETVRALHQLHSETWQVEKVNMEKNNHYIRPYYTCFKSTLFKAPFKVSIILYDTT